MLCDVHVQNVLWCPLTQEKRLGASQAVVLKLVHVAVPWEAFRPQCLVHGLRTRFHGSGWGLPRTPAASPSAGGGSDLNHGWEEEEEGSEAYDGVEGLLLSPPLLLSPHVSAVGAFGSDACLSLELGNMTSKVRI